MLGIGGELLFGIGQDALRGRSADAFAGIGLNRLDFGKNLLFGLTHPSSFLRRFRAWEPMRDYA